MYGKRFWKFVKFVGAMIGSLWFLFQARTASAVGGNKPSIMDGNADTSQLDSTVNQIVDFILFFAYAGGIVSLIIGIVLCAPVVGKGEKGLEVVKGAVYVLLASGTVHILYAFIGGLF